MTRASPFALCVGQIPTIDPNALLTTSICQVSESSRTPYPASSPKYGQILPFMAPLGTKLARFRELNQGDTREIETALLEGSIDFAVHSLKDLPTSLPDGLILGAVPEREDPRDALVGPSQILQLPAGMAIGTGSNRRQQQLQRLRPDLSFNDIRGNVPTRIEKWRSQQYPGGVVLAMAGLKRLRSALRSR